MIVGTPLEFVAERKAGWQARLEACARRKIGKATNDFRSYADKAHEETFCCGAIAALNEILNATYTKK